ncbi:MAG: transcription initiation factor IIB [Candidatus Nezhaarchaeota archaeon]|nr:transcription initiation factor IIB [Candidatus Nezhaarchaeota archaeon]MCX8141972.1 transcription initiation factor IIB [Candidatus Nezhaarchaeota archaeon]MDW8050247.1 transcription initiation factor IIB [Nitrososphaerota archaeon]
MKDQPTDESDFRCPECGSTDFFRDYDRAEMACAHCGLVISERLMDLGPEWRAFNSEQQDKRARAGAPLTLTIHDKGLSTIIDWHCNDKSSKFLSPTKRIQIYKLRKWQQRSRVSNAFERNLTFALSELERVASHLGLPRNVRESAAILYRKMVEARMIRGRSIESMVAAVIYAACRQNKIPRTLDEIAQVMNIKKREVGRSYRLLLRTLTAKITPVASISFIPRLVNKLNLSHDVQKLAITIIEKARDMGLTSGRGPMGIAAASIYIASVLQHVKCTQRDIASSANVTEVTIRNRYQELMRKLDFLVTI